ncbi:DUF4190 domain-containing protein [Streptomyces sp. CO7]
MATDQPDPHRPGTPEPTVGRPAYDRFAIAALASGLLCFVPPLGLILGAIALVGIRRTGRRGRGPALAGMALSATGTLLMVLFFTTTGGEALRERLVKALGRSTGQASVTAGLEPRDCFDEPGAPKDPADLATYAVVDIDEASCEDPHDAEVYARLDLPAGAFPGDGEVVAVVDQWCAEQMSAYSPDAWKLYEQARFHFYPPSEEDWARGERGAVCAFAPAEYGDQLTGSLRQDGDALDRHQRAYLEAAGQLNAALARVPLDDVEEALVHHQEWGSDVAGYLGLYAQDLRDHKWEGEAAPLAAELAEKADGVRGEWEKLAMLEDVDAFCDQWAVAEQTVADDVAGTVAALRTQLKLSTPRPVTTEYQYPPSSLLF